MATVLNHDHIRWILEEWEQKGRGTASDLMPVLESFNHFFDVGNRTGNKEIIDGLLKNEAAMKFTFMVYAAGRMSARMF